MNALGHAVPNASAGLEQRLSLDVQGVDALRRTVRSSPQEGLKQASRQFEALFMQMMLKSMREAMPDDALFGGEQVTTYTAMLDQQLSQSLSGHGLGLAEAMQAQLQRSLASTAAPTDARTAAADRPMPPPGAAPAPAAAPRAPAEPDGDTPQAGVSRYEQATAQATWSRSVYSQAHVEDFVTRLLPAAQRASARSGLPAQLIMAQAALESGWGRREVRGDDGRASYNLFGIKADKSWRGAVVEADTTEYVNGSARTTRARFRAYASYEESFADYARFLQDNPRYQQVLATPDATQAAIGLQDAGYATDPQYAGKLIRIMKQML